MPSSRLHPERLRAAMQAAGILTDAELSRRLGLASRLSPGQWRRGQATPAGDTLAKLCAVLDVTPGYLFGEDEPPQDELAEMIGRLRPHARELARAYIRALLDAQDGG